MKVLIFVCILTCIQLCHSFGDFSVEYQVYGNHNPNSAITVSPGNYSKFEYSPDYKYVILCHGYMEGLGGVPWYTLLINEFMKLPNDVVVITTTYPAAAMTLYNLAVENVPRIGEKIGTFIIGLSQAKGIPIKQFEIVGASLGGHVAGNTGRYIFDKAGARVGRLFALDPAGPLFENKPNCLRKEDSDRTIVLHTSFLGLQNSVGDLDFYPNGGKLQGGCALVYFGDHASSIFYFINGITNGKRYIGYKCNSDSDIDKENCINDSASMSYHVADSAKDGDYYLEIKCL